MPPPPATVAARHEDKSRVLGAHFGDMFAAGAGQACHALFDVAQSNAQQRGNVLVLIGRIDGAAAGLDFARHGLFGEVMATRRTAGAAIGMGKQIFDLLDAGIFEHVELLARDRQKKRKQAAQNGHERSCDEHAVSNAHTLPCFNKFAQRTEVSSLSLYLFTPH